MSMQIKARKEADWKDEKQKAWLHRGYMVTRMPGYDHLFRVVSEKSLYVPGLSGGFTTRPGAFAAIDAYVQAQAIDKAGSE